MLGLIELKIDCFKKENCHRDKDLCGGKLSWQISETGDWTQQQPYCDFVIDKKELQSVLDQISQIQLLPGNEDKKRAIKQELKEARARLSSLQKEVRKNGRRMKDRI